MFARPDAAGAIQRAPLDLASTVRRERVTWPPELSVNECAERLGVHSRTIRRYIAQGRLPARRVGPRLIRIKLEDLESMGQQIGGAA